MGGLQLTGRGCGPYGVRGGGWGLVPRCDRGTPWEPSCLYLAHAALHIQRRSHTCQSRVGHPEAPFHRILRLAPSLHERSMQVGVQASQRASQRSPVVRLCTLRPRRPCSIPSPPVHVPCPVGARPQHSTQQNNIPKVSYLSNHSFLRPLQPASSLLLYRPRDATAGQSLYVRMSNSKFSLLYTAPPAVPRSPPPACCCTTWTRWRTCRGWAPSPSCRGSSSSPTTRGSAACRGWTACRWGCVWACHVCQARPTCMTNCNLSTVDAQGGACSQDVCYRCIPRARATPRSMPQNSSSHMLMHHR